MIYNLMAEVSMKDLMRQLAGEQTNFLFLGEAGSGKSEIAINFARFLTQLGEKPVHFFDLSSFP